MGSTLARRYKNAIGDRNIQMEGHRGLSDSLDEAVVNHWETLCKEWDDAVYPKAKKKNPYQTPNACMSWFFSYSTILVIHLNTRIALSEAQVKKDLATEEARYLEGGGIFQHATTASSFVSLGLDLEDAQ